MSLISNEERRDRERILIFRQTMKQLLHDHLQDYWNENYDYVEESDLHEPRMSNDSINDQYKDDISEYEHMMQNIMPFIDASIQKVPDYRVRYFESTLQATAIHCNLGGDPTEHARMGYRVDVLIKLPGLHWSPDIGCGEISGVFQGALVLKNAKDQLNGVNTSNLVVWGFTVVGFLQKLNATKMMLANLNNERTKTLCCGIKRKRKAVSYSFSPIVSTPQSKKRKR
ncbi:hypothetical protein RhiirA4_507390 [Rhizophagus irregularis]|uniref:Uncharacterized protein n=1 Tax=Rhizophagus irregularis TaxID=588596 RepID=A0A2I1HC80_9GLOM|nr:hypothetical protein RhiirA4_507390 [Rhizophagus irregularis]